MGVVLTAMVVVTNPEYCTETTPLGIATRAMYYHLHKNYAHTMMNPACSVIAWAPLFDSHARLFRRVMACFRKHTSNKFHCSYASEVLGLSACVRQMGSCVASRTTRNTLEERLLYETIIDTYEEMSSELTTMYLRIMRYDIS